jgi:uncharacterized membrane protein (UPF0127 family)
MKYVFLPLLLLLMSCAAQPPEGMQEITLTSGGNSVKLYVEVADDLDEQAQGLMNRQTLPEGQGMLFVFPNPQPLAFWMKNTLISLDILFFDSSGTFISYQKMEPCLPGEAGSQLKSDHTAKTGENDPCQRYPSDRPAKYALEVNAGFVEREGVGEGWKLELGEN